MTPTEARQWTLKEIIDFCTECQAQYVGEPYEENGEEKQDIHPNYFALQDVIDKCEGLMNSISVAA